MSRASRSVVAIVAATVIIELFMLVTDMGPHLLLVTAVCVAIGATIRLVVGLGSAAVRWETVSEPHPPPPSRLPDLRVTLLRQGLSYGRHDDQIPERMYSSLIAAIDDELAVGHGIDREADPEAARAVLGDELTRFIEYPDEARSRSLEGLAHVVTLIERIHREVPA